eukprot:GHVU01034782.1.p1 GENE.GHVU01034782.1~~GHVU01034782.1.p1  ORF type:complete len:485 (+),score=39.13 GHVU01034782.1:2470-3924(+)
MKGVSEDRAETMIHALPWQDYFHMASFGPGEIGLTVALTSIDYSFANTIKWCNDAASTLCRAEWRYEDTVRQTGFSGRLLDRMPHLSAVESIGYSVPLCNAVFHSGRPIKSLSLHAAATENLRDCNIGILPFLEILELKGTGSLACFSSFSSSAAATLRKLVLDDHEGYSRDNGPPDGTFRSLISAEISAPLAVEVLAGMRIQLPAKTKEEGVKFSVKETGNETGSQSFATIKYEDGSIVASGNGASAVVLALCKSSGRMVKKISVTEKDTFCVVSNPPPSFGALEELRLIGRGSSRCYDDIADKCASTLSLLHIEDSHSFSRTLGREPLMELEKLTVKGGGDIVSVLSQLPLAIRERSKALKFKLVPHEGEEGEDGGLEGDIRNMGIAIGGQGAATIINSLDGGFVEALQWIRIREDYQFPGEGLRGRYLRASEVALEGVGARRAFASISNSCQPCLRRLEVKDYDDFPELEIPGVLENLEFA